MRLDLQQYQHFAEFVRLELDVGEPDSHMATVGAMVEGKPLHERIWMAGCYMGVYNAPGALVLHNHLQPWQFDGAVVQSWLHSEWEHLPFRRERRAIRTPRKLTLYLESYAKWMREWPRPWAFPDIDPGERYQRAYRDLEDAVYGVGRYALLKLLEFLRRYCGADIEQIGIRADRDAWSPKECLMLLFPDASLTDALAEDLSAYLRLRLADDGIDVDWYNLQVLLCDYKQVWKGKRQYVGRSLDSELEHAAKAEVKFDVGPFWAARARLFDNRLLGEFGGWDGVRKELGAFLVENGRNYDPLGVDA